MMRCVTRRARYIAVRYASNDRRFRSSRCWSSDSARVANTRARTRARACAHTHTRTLRRICTTMRLDNGRRPPISHTARRGQGSDMRVLTRRNVHEESIVSTAFLFMTPFSTSLWLMILGGITMTAVALYFLEVGRSLLGHGRPARPARPARPSSVGEGVLVRGALSRGLVVCIGRPSSSSFSWCRRGGVACRRPCRRRPCRPCRRRPPRPRPPRPPPPAAHSHPSRRLVGGSSSSLSSRRASTRSTTSPTGRRTRSCSASSSEESISRPVPPRARARPRDIDTCPGGQDGQPINQSS